MYARALGVPVISANKTGRFDTPVPLLWGVRFKHDFMGRSRIVDGQGNVLAELLTEQAVIFADIQPGPTGLPLEPIPDEKWFVDYAMIDRAAMNVPYAIGGARYTHSPARRKAAEKARD